MFASTWRLQEFGNHYGDYGQYAMDGEVPWPLMDGMLCSGHKFRLVTCAVFKSWITIIMDTVNNIYKYMYYTILYYTILYHTIPYHTILYYTIAIYAILPMEFNHQSMRDLYTQPKDSHGMDDQCHDFHDFTASWFEVSPWEDTGLPGMASAP
jgi:hypothetical protein